MKLLIVGSNSVHVSSFIASIENDKNELLLLAEESCSFVDSNREYAVSFRSLNPFFLIFNLIRLKRLIRILKPDLIHIHQVNRLAFFVSLVAVRLKLPFIVTAWGSDVLTIPKKNRLYFEMVRYVLKEAVFVTADSSEMIKTMRGISPDSTKYKLLQYGIDIVPQSDKEQLIFSNRLHKSLYQIDKIIDYFSEFVKYYSTWRLVIAGHGSETDHLKQLVIDYGIEDKVSFVGWLNKEENYDFYSRAEIYITLPKSDGMSVSVLEAMSAGCIPIVADLAVSKEWINNGVNGVICSSTSNPFFDAVKLSQPDVAVINLKLVNKKATRKASNALFFELYSKCIKL